MINNAKTTQEQVYSDDNYILIVQIIQKMKMNYNNLIKLNM